MDPVYILPSDGNQTRWMIRDADTITGYAAITDITNSFTYYVRIEAEVAQIIQQRNLQVFSIILLFILLFLFFSVSFLYCDRWILHRLESISSQVKSLFLDPANLKRYPISVKGDDEIAFLADAINRMVGDIIRVYRGLLDYQDKRPWLGLYQSSYCRGGNRPWIWEMSGSSIIRVKVRYLQIP